MRNYDDLADAELLRKAEELISTDELVAIMERIQAGEEPWPATEDEVDQGGKPTQAEAARLLGEMYKLPKLLPRQRCLAPVSPPCRNRPINSHTIHRAGPLSFLADRSGHVLSLERRFEPKVAQMFRVGLRDASTFPGLCAEHDSRLFKPIDRPLTNPTAEQLFLLSYRAVLKAQYDVRWSAKIGERGLIIAMKARMPRSIIGVKLAHLHLRAAFIERLNTIAEFYRDLYNKRLYSEAIIPLYGYKTITLPFAVSDYFEPTFNPDGSRIKGGLGSAVGPFVTLNVVPQREGSLAVLSYPWQFREDLKGFLDPFRPPIDEPVFLERIWETTLRHCEHIIVSPDYWGLIPEDVQDAILTFYNSPTHSWVPSPGCAVSLFNWYAKLMLHELIADAISPVLIGGLLHPTRP